VFVTHSIGEAVFLSDRVVLLRARPGGVQSVTPIHYERPRALDVEAAPGFRETVRDLRHQLETDDEVKA
jgi:NitT/TauT family transport system ATP-binding protein